MISSCRGVRSSGQYQPKYNDGKKALGPEHPDTLTGVCQLELVLLKQAKYEEAEAMHWRALEGYEEVLGLEHPHTLASMANLSTF